MEESPEHALAHKYIHYTDKTRPHSNCLHPSLTLSRNRHHHRVTAPSSSVSSDCQCLPRSVRSILLLLLFLLLRRPRKRMPIIHSKATRITTTEKPKTKKVFCHVRIHVQAYVHALFCLQNCDDKFEFPLFCLSFIY